MYALRVVALCYNHYITFTISNRAFFVNSSFPRASALTPSPGEKPLGRQLSFVCICFNHVATTLLRCAIQALLEEALPCPGLAQLASPPALNPGIEYIKSQSLLAGEFDGSSFWAYWDLALKLKHSSTQTIGSEFKREESKSLFRHIESDLHFTTKFRSSLLARRIGR